MLMIGSLREMTWLGEELGCVEPTFGLPLTGGVVIDCGCVRLVVVLVLVVLMLVVLLLALPVGGACASCAGGGRGGEGGVPG